MSSLVAFILLLAVAYSQEEPRPVQVHATSEVQGRMVYVTWTDGRTERFKPWQTTLLQDPHPVLVEKQLPHGLTEWRVEYFEVKTYQLGSQARGEPSPWEPEVAVQGDNFVIEAEWTGRETVWIKTNVPAHWPAPAAVLYAVPLLDEGRVYWSVMYYDRSSRLVDITGVDKTTLLEDNDPGRNEPLSAHCFYVAADGVHRFYLLDDPFGSPNQEMKREHVGTLVQYNQELPVWCDFQNQLPTNVFVSDPAERVVKVLGPNQSWRRLYSTGEFKLAVELSMSLCFGCKLPPELELSVACGWRNQQATIPLNSAGVFTPGFEESARISVANETEVVSCYVTNPSDTPSVFVATPDLRIPVHPHSLSYYPYQPGTWYPNMMVYPTP